MKKLVLKELREQFKVVLIGLMIHTVMLVIGFMASRAQLQQTLLSMYSDGQGLNPLLASATLTQTAIFCGILGTLLGWLQIRNEKHPDLWAFLVHRPITPMTILWSKIFSGLLLYGLGAGLPVVGLIVTASIPGKIATPFEWAMALPLVAIVLVGMVWYFAGLLTGLRKARWYASRGVGLGLAVVPTLGLFVMPEFWQALLIIGGAGAILALAVWGSFQTGGSYRDQPWFGKLALTLTSTASVMLLLSVVVTVSVNLFSGQNDFTYSQYQLTKDGKVIRINQHGFGDAEMFELSGKPLLDEKTGQKLKLKDLQSRYATGLFASADFGQQTRNRRRERYSSAGRFFHPWRVSDKMLWYLTFDGRLLGYHGITRRLVAGLRPPGSSAQAAPDDSRFVTPPNYSYRSFQPYQTPEIMASARTAYWVDLEKRELKPLLTVTNGDAIGMVSDRFNTPFVLLLTLSSIRLLDHDGSTKIQFPYQPPPPAYSTVSVLLLEPTNTFAARFEPDYFLNQESGGKLLTHIKWINGDGSIRSSMDLPKLPELQQNHPFAITCALALVPPAFPFYSWTPIYRVAHILRIVTAMICAGVGWWLGRRNNLALRTKIGWGVFHLLFGIPGLLAFVALQEWPAKERCASCQNLRAVDRERCEHCGARFPSLEKNGTEIFEPLTIG